MISHGLWINNDTVISGMSQFIGCNQYFFSLPLSPAYVEPLWAPLVIWERRSLLIMRLEIRETQ